MARTSEYVSFGLIAAAVGLTVITVLDRDRPTTKEQSARAGLLLRVFRPDEITRITVERPSEKLELVLEGETWKLTAPRIARVDLLSVIGLKNALQGARAERALGQVKGGERAQLGLDAPRARVEIAMKGVTLRLALGAPATGASEADGGALASYLEVEPYGDEQGGVFVVPPEVAAAIDRGADAYREPSLLGNQQSPTFTRMEVKGKNGDVVIERAPNGSWRLPGGARASADAVDGLHFALYELKAAPFVPDNTVVDPAAGGSVEITLASGGKLSATIGGACPVDPKQIVARAEGVTGCVPASVAERVLAPPSLYADPRAFWLQPGSESAKTSEIQSVLVEVAGQKIIDGERRGDGLHLRVPSDEQVDKDTTDRYLARLAAVAGTVVTPPPELASVGLAPPAGRVTIRRLVSASMLGPAAPDGGQQVIEQTVEVGAPMPADPAKKESGMIVHLRRLDDGAILRVPAELAQALRGSAAHELRSPNLVSLSGDSLTRVHVRPRDAALGFEIARKGGFWELTSPKGFGADPSSVGSITQTLGTLLCARWAAEKDDGTFGFDTPSLIVDVEREAKPAADGGAPDPSSPGLLTIELGKESNDANGGVYARVRGRDPVCVLPIGKRDALLNAPVDLRGVGFDPTDTPRIVVSRGARRRAIQYSDATKAWSDASDGGSDYLARKLADAVRGLRAEGLVHLGPAHPDQGFDTPTAIIEGYGEGKPATPKKRVVIGGKGKLAGTPVQFVRVDGIDATWAITRSDADAIESLL